MTEPQKELHTSPAQTLQFQAHTSPVQSLQLSRNGRYLLTCGLKEPMIKLWKVADGAEMSEFEVNSIHGTNDLCLDSRDERFVSSGANIQLWDILKTKPVQIWNTQKQLQNAEMCKVSQSKLVDGGLIFSAGYDGALKIFDIRQKLTGPIVEYQTSHEMLNCLELEGFKVCCGGNDGYLYSFDLRSDKLYSDMFDTKSQVMSIASDHAKTFLSMVGKTQICEYDLARGKLVSINQHCIDSVENYMVNICYRNDWLVSGSEQGKIYAFNGARREVFGLGKTGKGKVVKVASSKGLAGGNTVAGGCGDGVCHIVSIE
ncbi:unnamed protein product [Kuraishia capsulata CBS 1993]|uniref:Uncharacterized protein n=1 Tax=Kuraishia capsulata CBS 1993 TaxID=1382522 RepID=W6MUV3_9ASCO|nr:uncharacterized protein KUCA_T00001911001 [Kuraishia capsulata CBS 1993]CDK25940.1 unnamed protein product [Kuraishia capsulata CBS 1993]